MPPSPLLLIGALPPPPTGQSVAFRTLVEGLAEEGAPLRVVDLAERNTSRRDATATPGRALTLGRRWLQAAAHCLRYRGGTLYLQLAQSRVGLWRDLAFLRLARATGQRTVVHLHGGNYAGFHRELPPRRQRRLQRALAAVERIIVLADCFRMDFAFVPGWEEKVVVVPNGLPVAAAELPPPPEPPAPGPARPLQLLYLSNLLESKGYLELLEAMRILVHEENLPVRCHFAGAFLTAPDSARYATPAAAEADFHRRVAAAGLEDHVAWLGPVSGEAKRRELDAADIFVLPTRYRNEGQPVAVIEAMAWGCAVVSTRHRAIPELLDGGGAGVLLEEAAPAPLAAALAGLVRDPARLAALGRRAQARCRERYTREAHLATMRRHLLPAAALVRPDEEPEAPDTDDARGP